MLMPSFRASGHIDEATAPLPYEPLWSLVQGEEENGYIGVMLTVGPSVLTRSKPLG